MKKSFLKKLINNFREDFPIQIANNLVYFSDFFYSPKKPETTSQKNILIVRTDLLGDFIIWLNGLKFIAEKYRAQGYKVMLLANEAWEPIAKKTNLFDDIISISRKKYFKDFSYRKNVLNKLNKNSYEFLFQTAYSRDFAVADSIARNVPAKNKIAFRRNSEAEYRIWNLLSNAWYTNLIKADITIEFEFYRIKEYLNSIDFNIQKYSTEITEYFPKNNNPEKYFVVIPGAGAERRRLETKKFAEIITDIKIKTNLECIICGAPAEAYIAEKIQSELNFKIKNLAGKTSVIELGDVLTNASLVIGNETGALHYAAALNVPTVCILGGGHFKKCMPYEEGMTANEILPIAVYKKMECFNCNWRCKYVTEKNEIVPCISQLTSEYILQKTQPVLNQLNS